MIRKGEGFPQKYQGKLYEFLLHGSTLTWKEMLSVVLQGSALNVVLFNVFIQVSKSQNSDNTNTLLGDLANSLKKREKTDIDRLEQRAGIYMMQFNGKL